MTLKISEMTSCPECGADWKYVTPDDRHYSKLIGVEYAYGHPQRYDGVSEWMCPNCDTRWGRWTGKKLKRHESELRYGGK